MSLTNNTEKINEILNTVNSLPSAVDMVETDPTVPSWAKEATKPTYTASEVGAAASTHYHNATEITSGTLPVARGGTGNTSVDTAPTSGSTRMITSGGVYAALIGKADDSHSQAASTITAGTFAGRVQGNTTAMATLGNTQFRNIYAGTSDLTAGTSSLTTGTLYFVYE